MDIGATYVGERADLCITIEAEEWTKGQAQDDTRLFMVRKVPACKSPG